MIVRRNQKDPEGYLGNIGLKPTSRNQMMIET
jgi:hypothetical protein